MLGGAQDAKNYHASSGTSMLAGAQISRIVEFSTFFDCFWCDFFFVRPGHDVDVPGP